MRSASEATIPADLRAAIEADPRARKTFKTLSRQNLFALSFRTNNMKTPAGRAKKIAMLVAMLARGETIVPERPLRAKYDDHSLGVSFNSLLVGGVLGLIEGVPLSVNT